MASLFGFGIWLRVNCALSPASESLLCCLQSPFACSHRLWRFGLGYLWVLSCLTLLPFGDQKSVWEFFW